MSKSELGTKRTCPDCAAKFYDLGRNPAECPKCGHSFVPEVARKPSKVSAKVAKTNVTTPAEDTPPTPPAAKESKDDGAAVEPAVSFEEADQEASGASSSRAAALDEGDAVDLPDGDGDGDDDNDDDTTLLQEADDFDEDVASIVDADIKKEG